MHAHAPAPAERCYRAALGSYTLPATWTMKVSLKRDGRELPWDG